jgi:hypothetical protein
MRTLTVATALLAGFVLAACGGGDSSTATVVENNTTTVTQTATTGATTPATVGGETESPKSYGSFQSPSANIGCAAVNGDVVEVRCDIRNHDWKSPPKPANCELDYGGGLVIRAGATAEFVCAGDTTLNNGPILKYGETNRVGSIPCKSTEAGMTCLDDETGRGFFLSRQSYKLL